MLQYKCYKNVTTEFNCNYKTFKKDVKRELKNVALLKS